MHLPQWFKASAPLVALTAIASPALAQSSYTANRAQIDVDEVPDVKVVDVKTDPDFAQVGSMSDIYAKARASFGNNGAYAVADHQPANLGAYAESIWVDAFTVTGGSGPGTLDIGVWVNGTMDGAGQPGGPGSNAFYQLYVSNAPISCDFDALACTGTHLIPLTEGLNGSRLFTAQLAFNPGETFYLASYLGAEVLGNGFSDFYGSAHFGITAPDGSAITGGSGVAYALASSVPEPAAFALAFSGLAALVGLARRKGTRPLMG